MASVLNQPSGVAVWPDFGAVRSASAANTRPFGMQAFSKLVLLIVCCECVFSVAYRSVALATHSAKLSWPAGLLMVAVAVLCFGFRVPIQVKLQQWIGRLPADTPTWFWMWLVLGIFLRLAWVANYRITIKSDGAAYFYNAATLATAHTIRGTFWPPGLSLFEAPFFMLFGAHPWVTYLTTLLLFVGTYFLTYRLAVRLGGRLAAGIACVVLAGWPTLIALTPANCKECLLLFLITAIMLLHLLALKADGRRRWVLLSAAGLLIGCAALTQPGFNMFPIVSLAVLWVGGIRWGKALLALAVISASMLVAISPWTLRNYVVYHRVFLISTNGGSVFYAANNPHANADYMPDDPAVLSGDQFAADKEGYRAGEEWIRQHPLQFAALMVRKQVNFLGDDGIGPYETMKRELTHPRRFYALAKGVCNLVWMITWLLVMVSVPQMLQRRKWMLAMCLCFVPILYQLLIDSVFVSGGRHHVCFTGLLAIMTGLALSREAVAETVADAASATARHVHFEDRESPFDSLPPGFTPAT
ncbi:MAG TPA: glycosyltransferase family 39 protein [Bryocella sp.]|nr:glycosyltransferase family 39 protein [Bryocella sp.]